MPPSFDADRGVMATVYADGGYGYAATSDLSPAGVRAALERAAAWARATARHAIADTRAFPRPAPRGDYASPVRQPRPDRRGATGSTCCAAKWRRRRSTTASSTARRAMEIRTATHRLVTSAGGDATQRFRFLLPGLAVTAHAGGDTQTRTLHGHRGFCQQGGVEILRRFGFDGSGRRLAERGARAARRAQLPRPARWTCCCCPTR